MQNYLLRQGGTVWKVMRTKANQSTCLRKRNSGHKLKVTNHEDVYKGYILQLVWHETKYDSSLEQCVPKTFTYFNIQSLFFYEEVKKFSCSLVCPMPHFLIFRNVVESTGVTTESCEQKLIKGVWALKLLYHSIYLMTKLTRGYIVGGLQRAFTTLAVPKGSRPHPCTAWGQQSSF